MDVSYTTTISAENFMKKKTVHLYAEQSTFCLRSSYLVIKMRKIEDEKSVQYTQQSKVGIEDKTHYTSNMRLIF